MSFLGRAVLQHLSIRTSLICQLLSLFNKTRGACFSASYHYHAHAPYIAPAPPRRIYNYSCFIFPCPSPVSFTVCEAPVFRPGFCAVNKVAYLFPWQSYKYMYVSIEQCSVNRLLLSTTDRRTYALLQNYVYKTSISPRYDVTILVSQVTSYSSRFSPVSPTHDFMFPYRYTLTVHVILLPQLIDRH